MSPVRHQEDRDAGKRRPPSWCRGRRDEVSASLFDVGVLCYVPSYDLPFAWLIIKGSPPPAASNGGNPGGPSAFLDWWSVETLRP